MLDLIYAGLALGAFGLFALAVRGCERIQEQLMIGYALGAAIAAALFIYLLWALIRAEKF